MMFEYVNPGNLKTKVRGQSLITFPCSQLNKTKVTDTKSIQQPSERFKKATFKNLPEYGNISLYSERLLGTILKFSEAHMFNTEVCKIRLHYC